MQNIRSCFLAGLLAAMFSVSLSGCGGDGIRRCVVNGSVTFEGQPVANGEIRFVPDDGPISGGPIVNGKYSVTHKGGVPVGTHTVRIEARTVDSSAPQVEDIPDIIGGTEFQYIPEQYNRKSNLKVEVTGGENPLELNFDLEKSSSSN